MRWSWLVASSDLDVGDVLVVGVVLVVGATRPLGAVLGVSRELTTSFKELLLMYYLFNLSFAIYLLNSLLILLSAK